MSPHSLRPTRGPPVANGHGSLRQQRADGKGWLAKGLVVPVANANDALKIVRRGLSTIEVGDHDKVVGADRRENSCSSGVVEGDRDVTLAKHLLEPRTNEPGRSSTWDSVGSVPNELVMKHDESLRVVEVAIGKRRVRVHDVEVVRSCSVALLIQDEHATEIDRVSLGVVNVQLVHSLERGDSDRPANAP